MDNELLSVFRMEAMDHLTRVDNMLVSLESGKTGGGGVVTEIRREVHTLKGAARMLGLKSIANACHMLEDLFEAVFNGKTALTGTLVSGVLKTVDRIREAVDALPGREIEIEVDYSKPAPARPPVAEQVRPAATVVREGATPGFALPAAGKPASVARPPRTGDVAEKGGAQGAANEMVVLPQRKLRQLLNYSNTFTNYAGNFDFIAGSLGELLAGERGEEGLRESLEKFSAELLHESRFFLLAANHLQEAVASMLLVPIASVFDMMPRLARDAAEQCGKKVTCTVTGRDIEIDRQLIDEIRDMLIHLVRNAVDHGVEAPAARRAAGKPEEGAIRIGASTSQDRVTIVVRDDGRGLDTAAIRKRIIDRGLADAEALAKMEERQIHEFIFASGFSTAGAVSDISGRGVGMDVVAGIMKKYNSGVAIESVPGKGTTFTLNLPVNASVVSVTVFECGDDIFAFQSMQIQSIIQLQPQALRIVDGRNMFVHNGQVIPVIAADVLLGLADGEKQQPGIVIVVRAGEKYVGIGVEKIVFEKKMVLKQLAGMRVRFPQIAGMVALSSRCVVVLNPQGLLQGFAPAVQPGQKALLPG